MLEKQSLDAHLDRIQLNLQQDDVSFKRIRSEASTIRNRVMTATGEAFPAPQHDFQHSITKYHFNNLAPIFHWPELHLDSIRILHIFFVFFFFFQLFKCLGNNRKQQN